jgi:hypothetical protein
MTKERKSPCVIKMTMDEDVNDKYIYEVLRKIKIRQTSTLIIF